MTLELTSLHHPLVKHLARLRKNRQYRQAQGSVLVAGHHLVGELSSKATTKVVLLCDEVVLPPNVVPQNHYLVSENVMKKITGHPNPEGIAAEILLPKEHSLASKARWIALDQVSDPGNVGTLLRTALALGWEGAFLLRGSADPFHERAIRAAMGASFRLPLQSGSLDDLLEEAKGHTLLLLDHRGERVCDAPERAVLVLGNETHGIDERLAAKRMAIPMSGEMESLNVAAAGAIAMWELVR